MKEIYWITRLGEIHDIFLLMAIFALVIIAFAVFSYPLWDDMLKEKDKRITKKVVKWAFVSMVIGFIGSAFVPSTKEAYIIYGMGSTLDYIKSNDKARELPDKTVEALTKYLEEVSKEEK